MTRSNALRVAMVAGEPSGDLLAASLLGGLSRALPQATRCYGIGGPRMAAQGFEAHWPMDKLAVRGYVEALRHIPEILRIRGDLARPLRPFLTPQDAQNWKHPHVTIQNKVAPETARAPLTEIISGL